MKTACVSRRSVQFGGLVLFAALSVVVLLSAVPASAAIDSSSFAPKVDFTTNPGPIDLAIGDIDGDGLPDLAVSNYGFVGSGNTVRVLQNTSVSGNVSFTAALTLTTEAGPHGIEIGDINGDGKPDVVVANYDDHAGGTTLSVFRNTSSIGNVSFAAKADFGTGQGPANVAIGDIDGDDKPDLVVTNYDDGRGTTVSVLRNTSTSGSVSFATRVNFTTGTGPYGVAIGDIDGDGKPDLVVANSGLWSTGGGTTISVFRNTSTSGNVSFETKLDFPTGAGPRGVAISDIDGDGISDVMVANFGATGGATVSALRNTSTIANVSFAATVNFPTGTGPICVVIGDVDRDGKSDAVAANFSSGNVSALGNTSTIGNVSFAPKVDFATGAGPHGLVIGDIDGDSWLDLAAANWGTAGNGTTVSVLRKIPLLTVTKRAVNQGGDPLRPGERITYTITISNGGNIAATNVVVSDTFPVHTNFVAGSITITPSSAGGTPGTPGTQPVIASGITVTAQSLVTVTYAVTVSSPLPDGTVITNTASVTSAETVGSLSATTTDTITSFPILNIHKSSQDANGGVVVPGDTLTYTIVVTNSGTANATGAVISDTLPANTTFVPGSISLNPPGAGTPGATPPTLASNLIINPSQPVTVAFAVTVNKPLDAGTVITNTASVTSTQTPTPSTDTDSVTITASTTPAIDVVKAGPMTARVGDTVVYTFTLTNVGNTPLLNVQVVDDYAGTPILVSGDDGDSQLELAEVWVYTAAYTIQASDPDPLTNTVSVTATDAANTQATDTDQHSTHQHGTQLSASIYLPIILKNLGP